MVKGAEADFQSDWRWESTIKMLARESKKESQKKDRGKKIWGLAAGDERSEKGDGGATRFIQGTYTRKGHQTT